MNRMSANQNAYSFVTISVNVSLMMLTIWTPQATYVAHREMVPDKFIRRPKG